MKFLLADDHSLFREGLRLVLDEMVGESVSLVDAESFAEAAAAVRQHPDLSLVLLDFNMPGMDGVTGLQLLRRVNAGLPIIVLTASEDARLCRRAFDAGAVGYVTKSSSTGVMLQAIRTVLAGQTFVSPNVATDPSGDGRSGVAALAGRLTTRQFEVLSMLRKGKSNKEIARDLNLAEITVKMHVTAVFRALKVQNRTQAALVAEEMGL